MVGLNSHTFKSQLMGFKSKISISIAKHLNLSLEDLAEGLNVSKSALIERAIQQFIDNRLSYEAEQLAGANFDDLPSEEEWLSLQSEWPE